MNQRTKELLEKIDAAHDWACGQTRGGGGDVYTTADTCRICGLERHWSSGSRQNDVPASTTFITSKGDRITLREAVALEC
jgi:hypothetical protein